jgi:hypothetical protein
MQKECTMVGRDCNESNPEPMRGIDDNDDKLPRKPMGIAENKIKNL